MLAALVLLPAAGVAAEGEAACDAPPYHAFDFWLGDWTVSGAEGQQAGHNAITREQAGCVLVERWQGVQGGSGMSMNYYDPIAERWRQLWISAGTQIDISGGLVDGSMVLAGTITYTKDGRRRAFRGTWTPLEDGRVRQFFEEQDPAAGWQEWFEGFYARG